MRSVYDVDNRLSARQLSGFKGVRLAAVATVNSKGEPRAAPRSAAFLHGRFYLAANTKSVMAQRLEENPAVGMTYFENRLLIVAHGTVTQIRNGAPSFEGVRVEWEKAFRGGPQATRDIDVFIRVNATNMLAFAHHPGKYPAAWARSGSHG